MLFSLLKVHSRSLTTESPPNVQEEHGLDNDQPCLDHFHCQWHSSAGIQPSDKCSPQLHRRQMSYSCSKEVWIAELQVAGVSALLLASKYSSSGVLRHYCEEVGRLVMCFTFNLSACNYTINTLRIY